MIKDPRIGLIIPGTPRAKWVSPCETDMPGAKYVHLHLEDWEGQFSICTETDSYRNEADRAIFESEHDL